MPLEPRSNRRPWLLGAVAAGSIAVAALLIVTIVYFASGSGADNKETPVIPQTAVRSGAGSGRYRHARRFFNRR